MLALLQGVADKLLPVPKAEQQRSLIAFFLFGAFMASYYVLKPVRESLYVHFVGAERLPHIYLGSVAVAFVAMALYNRAFSLLPLPRLLYATVGVLAMCTLFFWVVSLTHIVPVRYTASAFFLWVSLYGVLCATLFWSVANDVFDLTTGRAVYGFVGIGGLVGATLGSGLTEFLVQHQLVVSENLLPIGSLFILATLPLIRRMYRDRRTLSPLDLSDFVASKNRPGKREGFEPLFREPYVRGLALLVFTMTFAGTLLILEYNQVLEVGLPGKEQKTAYLGWLYTLTNFLAILIQLLITGPIHRRFGPIPGLLPLPLSGLAAIGVLLTVPTLSAITAPWAFGLALMYSINQASKELLYIPTSQAVKYGTKGYIDVFVYRLGDGVASLLLIFRADLFQPQRAVMLLSLCAGTILIWLALIAFTRHGYLARTKDATAPV